MAELFPSVNCHGSKNSFFREDTLMSSASADTKSTFSGLMIEKQDLAKKTHCKILSPIKNFIFKKRIATSDHGEQRRIDESTEASLKQLMYYIWEQNKRNKIKCKNLLVLFFTHITWIASAICLHMLEARFSVKAP